MHGLRNSKYTKVHQFSANRGLSCGVAVSIAFRNSNGFLFCQMDFSTYILPNSMDFTSKRFQKCQTHSTVSQLRLQLRGRRISEGMIHQLTRHIQQKPGIERVQAFADILRSALCSPTVNGFDCGDKLVLSSTVFGDSSRHSASFFDSRCRWPCGSCTVAYNTARIRNLWNLKLSHKLSCM